MKTFKTNEQDKQILEYLMRITGRNAFKCCLCGETFYGYGNNPYPFCEDDADACCCDYCNSSKVIPSRIKALTSTN